MNWGRSLRFGAASGAFVALVGASIIGSPEAQAADTASASASLGTASLGELVIVSGTGWISAGNGLATTQICGQDAVNLTSDCDEANTYNAGIRSPGGYFQAGLYVHLPPTPCPCVLLVTSESGQSSKIPIQIVGAPYRAITTPQAVSEPLKLAATLDEPLSISSWFGGPRDLILKLRVTNETTVAITQTVVSVLAGRDSSSLQTLAGRTLTALPAGGTRTVQIPLTIPAVTYGHYTVLAQVTSEQGTVSTSLKTSSWPWAWLVLVVELILLAVVTIVRRVRERRFIDPESPRTAETPPVVAAETAVPETV